MFNKACLSYIDHSFVTDQSQFNTSLIYPHCLHSYGICFIPRFIFVERQLHPTIQKRSMHMLYLSSRYLIVSAFSTILLSACGGSSSDDSTTDDSTSSPTTGTIVINEIVAKAADDGSDWIELYVTEGSVDLSSYTIVDDDPDHSPQSLPNITLSSGEFLVVQAIDEEDTPPTSGYYVTFKLGSEDSVTLLYNDVSVDFLAWTDGDALEGFSYGLLPDGTGNAQTLTPTPGAANSDGSVVSLPSDTILNSDAELRINEIVAKDANGSYDWIELYVTGDSTISLSDYTLADAESGVLSLPDVTLAPGEFYRLAASTDVIDDNSIERVAFGLGASDTVSLYLGDDLIDQLSWSKGDALINYSFGRLPDGSDATATLSPTADTANLVAIRAQLVINEVVANDSEGGDDWFELYNNSDESISLADYQIIDESDDIDPITLPNITLLPGEYTVIYAADEDPGADYVAFKLGNADELSLIRNDETVDYIDWDASDVPSGYSYGLSPDGSWVKDTLIPTQGLSNEAVVVFDQTSVESIYINIDESEWADLLANAIDEEYHLASATYKGVTLDEVAIRTKGNSSLLAVAQSGGVRFSFKVDVNEYVDGQKLLGLKKFTLHNSYKDPTYMREYLAYQLMTFMGVPAPQTAFVNLYINNELHGLYLMVEAIDGEFLEDHYANANGDLYKPDGVGSDLLWISDDFTDYADVDLDSNEDTSDNQAFINFVDEMNNGDASSVIDEDSVLRYMSVSTALSNLDSYHGTLAHNYYIYEQDKVFSMLPWDLNESFGTFRAGCSNDVRELTIDEPTSGALAERPYVAKVFESQTNLDTYHTYLQALLDGPLAIATFENNVSTTADLIRDYVASDPTAFYSSTEFESALTTDSNVVYGLTSFIRLRTENIQQQLDGTIATVGDGSGFCAGGTGPGGGPR